MNQCKIGRRQFLRIAAGSGLALLLPPWGRARDTMMSRPIPATGEAMPVIGLGTGDEFNSMPADPSPLKEVLTTLANTGGSLIDTAPTYGNAESVLGRLFNDLNLQEQLFIASKISLWSPPEQTKQAGIDQMKVTEKKLGKSPMDLLQVHSLNDLETQWRNLLDWKEAGRVRYIGVTVSRYGLFERLERFMRNTPEIDFVQLNYSPIEPRAEEILIPLAADKGIAVMVNRPFTNGMYFRAVGDKKLPDWSSEFDCESWAQFSLKWILANNDVTCIIPATSKPKHMLDNARAASGALPDSTERRRILKYIQSI